MKLKSLILTCLFSSYAGIARADLKHQNGQIYWSSNKVMGSNGYVQSYGSYNDLIGDLNSFVTTMYDTQLDLFKGGAYAYDLGDCGLNITIYLPIYVYENGQFLGYAEESGGGTLSWVYHWYGNGNWGFQDPNTGEWLMNPINTSVENKILQNTTRVVWNNGGVGYTTVDPRSSQYNYSIALKDDCLTTASINLTQQQKAKCPNMKIHGRMAYGHRIKVTTPTKTDLNCE